MTVAPAEPASILYAVPARASQLLRAPRQPPFRAPTPLLGRRLRQARLLAGASRRELGAAIGVRAATVRRYEAGGHMPPRRFAAAAAFLGLPLSWFIRERE